MLVTARSMGRIEGVTEVITMATEGEGLQVHQQAHRASRGLRVGSLAEGEGMRPRVGVVPRGLTKMITGVVPLPHKKKNPAQDHQLGVTIGNHHLVQVFL